MTIKTAEPDKKFYPILKQYSEGSISATNAAYEIQQMKIAGFEDPSASEVIIWAKMAGYGIPSPSEDEAKAEAAELLRKRSEKK
ncbi:MAG: hypothetical protein PSY14_05790 [bacterium]|nr:hypothetical protein [bacterium]